MTVGLKKGKMRYTATSYKHESDVIVFEKKNYYKIFDNFLFLEF